MDEMTQIKVLHNVRTKNSLFKHKRAILNDQNLEDAIYNLVFPLYITYIRLEK